MTIKFIALIGFGEVGQTLAADISANIALSVYDPKFPVGHSPSIGNPVKLCASPVEAVRGADLILSAVTAGQTEIAAKSVIAGLKTNAWYLDVNSASPTAKVAANETINDAGGRYIESAIMSPINPQRMAAPLLLGGPHAMVFAPVAKSIGFTNARFYSALRGKTAAAKLCRSVVVKGMEALITEALLAARHYGVEEDVITSLENLFPHPDWQAHATYMIQRTLLHGRRRAEELNEAAQTVRDAGVDPWMSKATVQRQSWAGDTPVKYDEPDLAKLLDSIRALSKQMVESRNEARS